MKRLLIAAIVMALGLTFVSCNTEAEASNETEPVVTSERAEWSLDDIATLSEIVSGIADREYAVSEGADYKIHEDIAYDHDIIYTVLLNTAGVRFDVPGEYEMIYWVYFDAAALSGWADENGLTLDIPDTDRLAVWVYATVTVTEAEEEDIEDAEDAEDETDIPDDGTSTASSVSSGGSAKSTSSGSSKGGSSTCTHNWVDQSYYESVLVTAAYDERVLVGGHYVCNKCGASLSNSELDYHMTGSTGCHSSYYAVDDYETVHHDAVYETKLVSSYKCSKCGATK